MPTGPSNPVDQNLRVLLVSADPSLADELRDAFARIPDRQYTLFTAESDRDAIEAARRRQPQLTLLEIDRDGVELVALATELLAPVPDTVVAGVFASAWPAPRDADAPEEAKSPLGAWEYHSGMKLIEKSETKPLRIFTHVSENDLRSKDAEETNHNWVMAGQRTSAALTAKGYHHRFVFSKAAGHCGHRCQQRQAARG